MKKAVVISNFLTDANKDTIRNACSTAGFEVSFFKSGDEAAGASGSIDGEVLYCSYAPLLSQMPDLRWCHSSNAGVSDFVSSGMFDSGDVILTNSSGSYGRAISEHIIMVTLMLMRQMPEYRKVTDRRGWIHSLPIRSVAGSRIAIAGTGDLGRNTAERFRALGAESITGFNRSGRMPGGDGSFRTPHSGCKTGFDRSTGNAAFDKVYKISEIDSFLSDIDVLVMCLPETPETIGVLSADRIAGLPETAYVVNVGRGSAIDQEALVSALNEGRLAGAALDVMTPEPLPADHPLWTARNCIITPHIAGDMGLPYTVDRTVEIFCENIRRYAAGEPLLNRIDPKAGY